MSESKHRSRPWRYVKYGVYTSDGESVALIANAGRNERPDLAEIADTNGRLIAAAPDLKQALYDILYADSDNQIPNKLFKAAKAALDKSEGRL